MRNRTAHKTNGSPLRTLGLSVVFAGTLLATSVAGVAAMRVAHDALPDSDWVGGVPHQVAPLEGQDEILVPAQINPSTVAGNSGVPHQVAPFEGQDTITPDPPTSPGSRGVPHQVAPFEG